MGFHFFQNSRVPTVRSVSGISPALAPLTVLTVLVARDGRAGLHLHLVGQLGGRRLIQIGDVRVGGAELVGAVRRAVIFVLRRLRGQVLPPHGVFNCFPIMVSLPRLPFVERLGVSRLALRRVEELVEVEVLEDASGFLLVLLGFPILYPWLLLGLSALPLVRTNSVSNEAVTVGSRLKLGVFQQFL